MKEYVSEQIQELRVEIENKIDDEIEELKNDM